MAKMVTKNKASTAAVEDGPTNTTKKSKVLKMPKNADPEPAKKAKAKGGNLPVRKMTGRTTGLSALHYQNKLMKDNFKAKLTDEQLAAAMRKEFPEAVAYTIGHVRGIRGAWNKGKHGNEVPQRELPEFDSKGNVVPKRRFGPPKKKDDAAAPAKKSKKAKAEEVEEEEPEEDEEEADEEETEDEESEDEDEEEEDEEDEDDDE